MPRPRLQFSLQSLLVFVTVAAVLIGLNVRTSVAKVYSGKMLAFGRGEFDIDQLQAQRGWPFRYLDYLQTVPFGTGDERIAQGWPSDARHVPVVTSVGRLLADLMLGIVLAGLTPLVVRVSAQAWRHRRAWNRWRKLIAQSLVIRLAQSIATNRST